MARYPTAELANVANEPGNVLRSRLHTLQRLTAITNEDPAVCAETTEALKATITVPTLRMNSMDLYVPFDRDDFDQAMDMIPASVSAEWRDARDALAASEEPVDTTFAIGHCAAPASCMLRARRSRLVPIHRLAGAFRVTACTPSSSNMLRWV